MAVTFGVGLFWDYRISGDPPEEEKPLMGRSSRKVEEVEQRGDVGPGEEAGTGSGTADSGLRDGVPEDAELSGTRGTSQRGYVRPGPRRRRRPR